MVKIPKNKFGPGERIAYYEELGPNSGPAAAIGFIKEVIPQEDGSFKYVVGISDGGLFLINEKNLVGVERRN